MVIIYNEVREAARREVFREHDFSSPVCCKLLALGNSLPFSLVCQWAVECGFVCCHGKCCEELSRFVVGGYHIDFPLFDLGDVAITKDIKKLSSHGLTPWVMVFKHVTGMWGDLTKEEWESNQEGVQEEWTVCSRYGVMGNLGDIWVEVVTDLDNGITMVMLPPDF
tara:strand:+ start:202 stop:699 length:498 start_codon:yes stop_codon:yes gene_type:complete